MICPQGGVGNRHGRPFLSEWRGRAFGGDGAQPGNRGATGANGTPPRRTECPAK